MESHTLRNNQLLAIAGKLGRFGGWSVDLREGRVHWSDEVCAIHDEPPGTSVSVDEGIAYYAPEWRSVIRDRFTRCAEEGIPYDLELEILTRTGRRVWVRAIGEPVRDDDGRIVRVQGAFQDLTALKEREARIEGLESRLRRVLETMSDAFFTLDREWRFTFLNAEAVRMLRRPAEELLGQVVWDAFPEAEQTPFWTEYHRAMEERSPAHVEAFYAPLDRWFSADVHPVDDGLAVYFRDVTETRRSEERFQAATGAAELGVFDWPVGKGRGWVSDSLHAILGLEPGGNRLSMRDWLSQVVPEDRERAVADAVAASESGGEYQSDFRIERTDGEVRWIRVRGRVVREGQDGPLRVIGAAADITERQRAEERLRHAQKLEAVGRLSGGIAHDFNNLLTIIQAGCRELVDELPADSPLREAATESLEAAEAGARLTRQLLAFSRRQVTKKEVLDAGEVALLLKPMLRRTLPQSVELDVEAKDAGLFVQADRDQLQQVVLNLVANAVDAVGDRGRIDVTVDRIRLSKEEAAGFAWETAPGPYVRLTVRDNGCGMPPEVLERVFEPFFTTKPVGHGTGLGLPTVYGIVKEAGGHLLAESEPGEGSTFRALLPLSRAPAASEGSSRDAGY